MKKLFRDNKGQALVEMALVLPILVILLLGIMEFSRLFAGYLELQNAARDGARYAAVHLTDISQFNQVKADTKEYVKGRFVMLDTSKLDNPSENFSLKSLGNNQDAWVEVTLKYQVNIVTPVISSLTGNPINISAKMSMRRE
ncbi:MAG: TadE/TadG family type IV pilus assembly protein [Eubacteriales bacterium]